LIACLFNPRDTIMTLSLMVISHFMMTISWQPWASDMGTAWSHPIPDYSYVVKM
jgi:hypothetical protein